MFPYLQSVRGSDRATEFKQRCVGLGIQGVTLHSYRYAWAERAKVVGYPERFAQLALGHNSKAVHRAYAKNAQVTLPPLEEYEREHEQKVVPLIAMQTSESDDGLIREWTPPDHPSLHHIGYAVMWFILALMAGLYGWFLWKRN